MALGQCGLALTGGMPILQEYYKAMMRSAHGKALTDPSLETGMAMLAHGLKAFEAPVTDSARISFDLAFGIAPPLQCMLERYYKSLDLTYAAAIVGEPAHIFL